MGRTEGARGLWPMLLLGGIMLAGIAAAGQKQIQLAQVMAEPMPADLVITLERTACYGSCPDFTLTLDARGHVQFQGRGYVLVEGGRERDVPGKDVAELYRFMLASGYLDFHDEYSSRVTDHPSAITSLTARGASKKVRHYLAEGTGAPEVLASIEKRIAEVAQIAPWVGTRQQIQEMYQARLNAGHGSMPADAVIRLERTRCSRSCPVYTVDVDARGHVVFEGRAFVAKKGRHEHDVPVADVGQLYWSLLQASFDDLKPEYATDAPGRPWAISSLTTGGKTKAVRHLLARGTRAPPGLEEFELQIDGVAHTAAWVGLDAEVWDSLRDPEPADVKR
ncbi:MAG: hypothetical protein JST92_20270 [Deltaproteobacteria bacterium]|nr:hypothetical protein [Deltaproteobacteria bacterium]